MTEVRLLSKMIFKWERFGLPGASFHCAILLNHFFDEKDGKTANIRLAPRGFGLLHYIIMIGVEVLGKVGF